MLYLAQGFGKTYQKLGITKGKNVKDSNLCPTISKIALSSYRTCTHTLSGIRVGAS